MWGRDASHAMSSPEVGLPVDFSAGRFIGASDEIDPKSTRNVKWIAKLGSMTYGNPTVAGGKVFVGTNNDAPRDPGARGDRCNVYCFDEATGGFLWQLTVPKLGTGMVSDWEYLGMCSGPAVEGNRAYLVTNRCEVICLDVNGLADGNDGPFQDEARYKAGPEGEPAPLVPTDADIIWVFDMIKECGVHPHNITSSAVLIAGDDLWVTTSNGVDVEHGDIPAPDAPSLILVDKKTGKLRAVEASGLSSRMFHASWTSPTFLSTGETQLGIFGGPDGFCYAFAPTPVAGKDGKPILKEVWRVDGNRPEYRTTDGKAVPYGDRNGPSEMIATPVVYEGRIYCAIGQEPDSGEGGGNLVCIDATGKVLWSYGKINRTMSTPAIGGGLVFAPDYSGFVHCLDARTGEAYWVHDTMGHTWSSPLLADGKVYLGNEDGYLTILPATKEYDKGKAIELDMGAPLYSSAIAANGVLYLSTHTHLFAIAEPADGK